MFTNFALLQQSHTYFVPLFGPFCNLEMLCFKLVAYAVVNLKSSSLFIWAMISLQQEVEEQYRGSQNLNYVVTKVCDQEMWVMTVQDTRVHLEELPVDKDCVLFIEAQNSFGRPSPQRLQGIKIPAQDKGALL